jgi:predicted phosphodiesterase
VSSILRKKVEDWIVVSDAHIPHHNRTLTQKVYQIIREVKPYGVAILGDWIDFKTLSYFAEGSLKELENVTVGAEYAQGSAELDNLDSVLPAGCKKVFIMGNHEERYKTFLEHKDHSKLKDVLTSPAEGLKLYERGYHVVHDWQNGFYVLGSSLELIHGISTAPFAANVHLNKFQGSVMSGHAHILQHTCTNKRGSWIIGGLFDLKDEKGFGWAPRPTRERWSNGFAYVIINGHGYHHVHLIQAFNNNFVFGAQLI